MTKTTLLSAGAWALGLLAGIFAWLSPDSALFPTPTVALVLVGLAVVLLLVGAARSGFTSGGPKPSVGETVRAIAPLPGAAVALVFAACGWLPNPALPLLFVILFSGAVIWSTRGRWTSPITWVGDLWTSALMVLALFVVLPALLLGAMGQVLWTVVTPNFNRALAQARLTDILVQYRPTPRAGITAEAAGIAFQAISANGSDRSDSLLVEYPAATMRPWLPDSSPFEGWKGDSVLRHALRGLSKGERAWLERIGTHPHFALIDTVAYAAAMDPWVAVRMPLPAGMTGFDLPLPRFFGIQSAARAELYRAALAMVDHRPAVADSLVRIVIGLGLRLRDDSDFLIGAFIGANVAREAGLTLAEVWRASGRRADGDALVAALAMPVDSTTPSTPAESLTTRLVRARFIAMAQSGAAGRAMRWEHLTFLGISACTDLRELLYGPTPAVREAFTAAAPMFQRSPKEREVFAFLSRGITSEWDAEGLTPALRPAALAFGRRPLAACARVVFGSGGMY